MCFRICSSLLLCVLMLTSCSKGNVQRVQDKPSSAQVQKIEPIVERPIDEESRKRYQFALALLERKRYVEAEEQLRSLTEKFPNLYTPYASLARLYSEQERYEEAVKMLRTAIKINPNDSQLYNQLGISFRQQGQFRNSAIAYLEAIRLDRKNAMAERNLAILYDLYLNELDNAEKHYLRYRELAPHEAKLIDAWLLDLNRRKGK